MSALVFISVMLLFVILQNILYEKYVFYKIDIDRGFEEDGVFPGESISYKFSIVNKKLLPLTWLSIEEIFPNSLEFENVNMIEPFSEVSFLHKLVYSILPFQRVNRKYRVKCLKRGYYQPKDITLTATNLFGSKIYSEERVVQRSITVFPNIRELGDEFVPANTMLGDYSVKRWIIDDPMMIIGIKDYQSSDSFKSINWNLTAKNQKLLVNKYDYTADKKIMLIFHIDKSEFSLEPTEIELIETALEVGASIGAKLIESGIPTGVASNVVCLGENAVGVIEPDTGKPHIAKLLTAFAQMSYMKRFQSRELLKLLIKDFSWGTEIMVLTLEATDELMSDLEDIGHIKTTVIAFKNNKVRHIPQNVSLFYHSKEGGKVERNHQ